MKQRGRVMRLSEDFEEFDDITYEDGLEQISDEVFEKIDTIADEYCVAEPDTDWEAELREEFNKIKGVLKGDDYLARVVMIEYLGFDEDEIDALSDEDLDDDIDDDLEIEGDFDDDFNDDYVDEVLSKGDLASTINDLIKDEYTAVDKYNASITNLKTSQGLSEADNSNLLETLEHILAEEQSHIEMLQKHLAQYTNPTEPHDEDDVDIEVKEIEPKNDETVGATLNPNEVDDDFSPMSEDDTKKLMQN